MSAREGIQLDQRFSPPTLFIVIGRSPVPLTSWIAQAALRELYTVGDSAPRGEVGHPKVVLRALPLSHLLTRKQQKIK